MSDTHADPSAALAALAPSGNLRASINLGNPVLAKRDAATGEVTGVSVDLAQALAEWLGVVALELVVVDTAAKSVENVGAGRADVGFFAIDPLREAELAFTVPYLFIEGAYLVREHSPIRDMRDVDREGLRVGVGQGSAYDLYLSRHLQHAQIVRAPTYPEAMNRFLAEGLEVAAGVRQQIEADAARLSGLRLLPGSFMQIAQAMATPQARGAPAAALLRAFVQRQIAAGNVAAALARHGVQGVRAATPTTA